MIWKTLVEESYFLACQNSGWSTSILFSLGRPGSAQTESEMPMNLKTRQEYVFNPRHISFSNLYSRHTAQHVATAMATRLGEVLCRLLLYTSTAQSSQNRGTIEFTTPFFVAPTSMLFCFNDTTIDLPSSGFDIVSFNQGGSIFNESEQVIVSTGGNWRNSQFFARSSAFTLLEPLEYGALQDVLSTDPFYGTSFVNQR